MKLVLWRHWMHRSYMHPVTSENQFHCTRLYTACIPVFNNVDANCNVSHPMGLAAFFVSAQTVLQSRPISVAIYFWYIWYKRWGPCEYVIVHTVLPPSPVILWIELGGNPKWLLLNFGYHDVMRTRPIYSETYLLYFELNPINTVCTGLYVQVCMYRSVCTGLYVQVCMYRSVCTGLYVQVCMYRSVCTGLYVQVCMYRSVCTGLYVQVCMYRSVCTGLYVQVCMYRSVCTGLYVQVCPSSPTRLRWKHEDLDLMITISGDTALEQSQSSIRLWLLEGSVAWKRYR